MTTIPRGRIPDELCLRDRMERKLLTQRVRGFYKKRGQIVEPVFGQIKTVIGIRTFMRRGFEACAQEWKPICATHTSPEVMTQRQGSSRLLMKEKRQRTADEMMKSRLIRALIRGDLHGET